MCCLNTSSLLSLILLVLTLFFPLNCHSKGNGSKIKGMFVFGDPLVDNGNNDFLEVNGKPNYFPYGIDFSNGPTGRFTNGKTVVDIFGDLLSLPHLIPPFYDPSTNGPKIINGVNFASGGSGLRDTTNSHSGKVATFSTQMKNFEVTTLPALEVQLGMKRDQFLGNYLFFMEVGTNDITQQFPPPQPIQVFTTNLIQSLSGYIKHLYSLGGRKFVVMSLYPLGCFPVSRDAQNKCSQPLNDAANIYNSQLKSMVVDLNSQMLGCHLVFVDTYNIVNDLITNPISQGFKDAINPCCELISFKGKKYSPCNKDGKTCPDREANIFFDGVHPIETVNSIIASKAYTSNLQSEVYPINVSQLSTLL